MAKQKILKAIESVDSFFKNNPLLEMMLKSEYLLNYFRVLIQNNELEEAKKISFALLKLVFYQENSKNIVQVKKIKSLKGPLIGHETMKFNFVNYIFRRIMLLPERTQDEFISYMSDHQTYRNNKTDIFSLLKILNLNICNQHKLFLREITDFFDENFIINNPMPVLNLIFNKINTSCKSEYNVSLLKEIENFKNKFSIS